MFFSERSRLKLFFYTAFGNSGGSILNLGKNSLKNHGLKKRRDHGITGFKRYVGFGVVARNLQIIGHALILYNQKNYNY
jgi:hypothetical protein